MDSLESIVSADGLTKLFVIVLYAAVVVFSYRWLFLKLAPIYARIGAGFLLAQALVIMLALHLRPAASPAWWYWDLNREYNIASTLASLQLALVGWVALMTAWLARAAPAWRRLYLIAIAAVFLILAWDEYFKLHEQMLHWKRYYAALGIGLALSTMIVALRSPRRMWKWRLCLLAGLALSGTGAILLEELPLICGVLGSIRLNGCLAFDVWEECLEFIGVWLALAAMLGILSAEAPNPRFRYQIPLFGFPALWLLLVIIYTGIPQFERHFLATSASTEFESGVRLHGYHIDGSAESSSIRLYVSAKRGIYADIGYSLQLVDQISGETVASASEKADPSLGFWMLPPGASPLYRHAMEVVVPPDTDSNRPLWFTLSLWREREAGRGLLRIIDSDRKQLTENQVILE